MAWAATEPLFAASDVAARLARLRRLAWMIDAVFLLPGTRFRFGLNSVIGLLPVGGDTVLGGSVPIIGDLFDMALKANLRNLAIIEDHVRGAGWQQARWTR